MKANGPKPKRCSKSNSKREVYNKTALHHKTRKTFNKQHNLTSKTTGERRTNKASKRKEIIKIRAEIIKLR